MVLAPTRELAQQVGRSLGIQMHTAKSKTNQFLPKERKSVSACFWWGKSGRRALRPWASPTLVSPALTSPRPQIEEEVLKLAHYTDFK